MTQPFQDYCTEFERVFHFDQDGNLLLKREEMEGFVHPTNRLILAIAGSPEVVFVKFSDDQAEARKEALRLYGICYWAYLKIRQLLQTYHP